MWRGATIFLLLTISNRISAKFFSEAGGYQLPNNGQPQQENRVEGDPGQYYDLELQKDQLSPYQQPQYQGGDDDRLAGIVDELQKMQNVESPNDDANFQAYPENPYYDINDRVNENFDPEALKTLEKNEKPVVKEMEKEKPEQVIELKQPLTAQKKGQSEFETFVEPISSNQLKNVEFMDKRVPAEAHMGGGQSVQALHSSGNIVFIALITMCCVAAVVGVVGGAYYYNNVRKASENNFDDFTRYSPAGPGRDKKQKKGRNGSGGNITENGDESLAYKAQLHHYQQTKQKIIGAEEGMAGIPNVEEDDKSDDELEEHNFSVYECPGLAPTGDIEVQNPNFDIKRHDASP